MIAAIDIETKGLNAQAYITGCIITNQKKTAEHYTNKEELWKRVLKLGIKEAKRNKILTIYSHNAQYDTAGYINLNDQHLKIYSNKPFIWSYQLNKQELEENNIPNKENKENKEIIKFLDTYSIYKMSLKDIGKLIGRPKLEMPNELIDEKTYITKEKLTEIQKYCEEDTRICLESIQYLNKKLEKEGIKLKRLYTINQIGIAYLIKKIIKNNNQKNLEPIFWNVKTGETRRTLRREEIHSAYRGGRVEAFQTGKHEHVTSIDINSLYPWSLKTMKIPNLSTERKNWKPNKKEYQKILGKIGVTRCMIKNENNELGLLPIRTPNGNHYPRTNTIMIGTWTNIELQKAQTEGYKLIDIEWSITYEETNNIFTNTIKEMYKLRKESTNEFDNYFYKQMMNSGIGKMAQQRTEDEIIIDEIEKADEYLKRNYEIIKGLKGTYNYMYKKENIGKTKKYYMPIIPTLVNANARIRIYDELKKIPLKKLLYTDTDSIIWKNDNTELEQYTINNELGGWKITDQNTECLIYGRKNYSIGDKIKIGGISPRGVNKEDFEKGYIESNQMNTIKTAKKISDVGTFTKTSRNLKEITTNYEEIQRRLNEEPILIDHDIEEINHFIPTINKQLK